MIQLEQNPTPKTDSKKEEDPLDAFRKILRDATQPKEKPGETEQNPPKTTDKPQE